MGTGVRVGGLGAREVGAEVVGGVVGWKWQLGETVRFGCRKSLVHFEAELVSRIKNEIQANHPLDPTFPRNWGHSWDCLDHRPWQVVNSCKAALHVLGADASKPPGWEVLVKVERLRCLGGSVGWLGEVWSRGKQVLDEVTCGECVHLYDLQCIHVYVYTHVPVYTV